MAIIAAQQIEGLDLGWAELVLKSLGRRLKVKDGGCLECVDVKPLLSVQGSIHTKV